MALAGILLGGAILMPSHAGLQPEEEYFEGFDCAGQPPDRQGLSWSATTGLSKNADWQTLVPGDGFAHFCVERSFLNDTLSGSEVWPFQTLSLGPVSKNHRISIRAKNTAIPGVAFLLFTYRETITVHEIDIEVVAEDTRGSNPGHLIDPPDGWTDIRLNAWARADKSTLLPFTSIQRPIQDRSGSKVSHRDGLFHIYTIEWKSSEIRFYIDNVLQGFIKDNIPQEASTVIFGLRQTPWAGTPGWRDRQTALVDWIDVEPLSDP